MFSLYSAPKSTPWQGRTQPEGGYWHQHIKLTSLEALPTAGDPRGCVLLGYACDAGVKRNQGRPGAAQAPAAFWPQLAKLSWHLPKDVEVFVAGEIRCQADELEASQEALAQAVSHIQAHGYPTLIMGGGHEIAYAHGTGLRRVWEKEGKKWGILNLDAHFDLRKPNPSGNSGTPFYQLLSEGQIPYAVAGIQPAANPYSLFDDAKKWGVSWLEDTDCQDLERTADWVNAFLVELDYVYLSLDMDVLNRAHAPGVSAPNPMGFTPHQVSAIIDLVARSGKLKSMDIAECNPAFDQDGATLRLAARFAAQAIEGMVGRDDTSFP